MAAAAEVNQDDAALLALGECPERPRASTGARGRAIPPPPLPPAAALSLPDLARTPDTASARSAPTTTHVVDADDEDADDDDDDDGEEGGAKLDLAALARGEGIPQGSSLQPVCLGAPHEVPPEVDRALGTLAGNLREGVVPVKLSREFVNGKLKLRPKYTTRAEVHGMLRSAYLRAYAKDGYTVFGGLNMGGNPMNVCAILACLSSEMTTRMACECRENGVKTFFF